jgi:hypothetical protein
MSGVTHTTHIHQAVEIIRNGTVSAGLVFDKSKLKRYRMRVVWLSPNYWHPGFRYGNIQFHFKLRNVLRGMKAYYVEAAKYETRAPRILLTDQPDRDKRFTPYEPSDRSGPWWHDVPNKKHYFNSKYTLELMLELDLSLIDASEITFVKHHEKYCSVHPSNPDACKETGCEGKRAGGYFIARIVGERLGRNAAQLVTMDSGPSPALRGAWQSIKSDLSRLATEFSGAMKADDRSASAVGRAILGSYGARHGKDVKALARLFVSESALREAVQRSIEETFELTEGALSES